MHEPPDAARALYRRNQRPDQQCENQHSCVSGIRKDADRAVKTVGETRQRIELAQQRMAHPDAGKQRQNDLLAPDGQYNGEQGRQD